MALGSGSAARVAADESLWKALQARLVQREAAVPVAVLDAPEFAACVAEYHFDLDEGEFLLRGKELVASPLSDAAKPDTETFAATATIDAGELGTLTIADIPAADASPGTAERALRGKRYEALWGEFLETLRTRLASAAVPVKIVKNMR